MFSYLLSDSLMLARDLLFTFYRILTLCYLSSVVSFTCFTRRAVALIFTTVLLKNKSLQYDDFSKCQQI